MVRNAVIASANAGALGDSLERRPRRRRRLWRRSAPSAFLLTGLAAGAALANSGSEPPAVALSAAEIALAALKYIGVAVGSASGIWALTRKLSYDDEHNVRHLTRAGKIGLAFGVGSFLVASAAASMELLLANVKKQNQLLSDAAARDAATVRERRAAEEAARVRDLLLKNLTITALGESKRRADSTAQRLLALETAAKEEKRDARLALRVAQSAASEQRNTARVLRTLWQEANRVEGSRIELLAGHNCSSRASGGRFQIFGPRSQASLMLIEAGEEDPSKALYPLAGLSALKGALFALRQEEIDPPAADGEEEPPLVRFHTFFALEPDAISSPETWRDAQVKVVIAGPAAKNIPADLAGSGTPSSMSRLPSSWAKDNDVERLLPCEVETNLLVNGRLLATGSGPIGMLTDDDTDATLLVAEVPFTPIDNKSLPIYSQPRDE